jgi:hypothetical protein
VTGAPTWTAIKSDLTTWTDAELTQFEAAWPLGTPKRLAYALLRYTGQRGVTDRNEYDDFSMAC